jgi:threonylcarbamoyladenosine tRNA methylthiotransferase MtaB
LREKGEAALRRRLAAELGAIRNVLIESPTQGRTEHYLPVAVSGFAVGSVQALRIVAQDGRQLRV